MYFIVFAHYAVFAYKSPTEAHFPEVCPISQNQVMSWFIGQKSSLGTCGPSLHLGVTLVRALSQLPSVGISI